MLKSKPNYWDLFDQVQSGMKTRQDNDMTHCTSAIYIENDNELSWSIKPITICD